MLAATVTLSDVAVQHFEPPEAIELVEELGRGANNRVYAVEHGDDEVVLRVPRRRSDTQQTGSAIWELRHTLRASELGVGPNVLDAWHARHSKGKWTSGLYLLLERIQTDLERMMLDPEEHETLLEQSAAIGTATWELLQVLAKDRLFVYDLKPSNVVVDADDEEVRVRIIDFGRDFCEWGGPCKGHDRRTPHLDLLTALVAERDDLDEAAREELITHVLSVTMMVVLSATTTYRLYHDRREHKMSSDMRKRAHPFASLASTLLDDMQGRNRTLVRALLRDDDVRGVLRHYHSRRCAGTHRTFALARGDEL